MSNWKMTLTRMIYRIEQVKGMAEVRDPLGVFKFMFCTLELPWLDNAVRKSCIPFGIYRCKKRWSKTYGWHWEVLDVHGRSLILIHFGNFNFNTLGCILPGEEFKDLNGDGLLDITNSKKVMKQLLELLPDEFELEIIP